MTEPLAAATILDALAERAARQKEQVTYAFADEKVTYGALLDDVRRIAAVLAERGVGRSDRCALVAPTSLDIVRAIFAVQSLGASPIVINPGLPPALAARRVQLARCKLAFVPAASNEALSSAATECSPATRFESIEDLIADASRASPASPVQVHPEEVAYLQFTSGTTGEPRAAVILHRHLVANLRASHQALNIRPDDVLVGWLPLHHDFGLVRFVFGPLFFGCPGYLVPSGIETVARWLQVISRFGGTLTSSPDFGFRIAAERVDPGSVDLTSLRIATSGGEAIRLSTIQDFESRFEVPGVIRPGYGLAEVTLTVSVVLPGELVKTDDEGHVGCGPPMPGTEIRIVDERGIDVPPGTAGEILVRSPSVFAGYFDDEAATRAVLRDGWLYTGDQGKVDADGCLFVLGRERAMIKRGGATIVPREIEEAAERVAGIVLAAAIGLRGETDASECLVLVAELDPRAGANRQQVIPQLAAEVTRAVGSAPSEILVVRPGTIPRTGSGKVRHAELKRLVMSGRLPEGPAAASST
jgi:acyl-CoA synthetase (AMP-forming)/AMP-acid ligase II